jgi:hypothetical protein
MRPHVAHKFTLSPESLRRRFAVYVVIARRHRSTKLYVGKTGDNRDGCNPVISRCGNHFSYNNVHSQVRNKIPDHERWKYTCIFDHFDEYDGSRKNRLQAIARINEMERWLNAEVQRTTAGRDSCELLNPYAGKGHVSSFERSRRAAFRKDRTARWKINGIVAAMLQELEGPARDASPISGRCQDTVSHNRCPADAIVNS